MAVIENIDLKPVDAAILDSLLRAYVPAAEVRAFGSRVRGNARSSSDLDLVILASPEQTKKVEELKDAFEQSDLPFRVDCHVWSELPINFREKIEDGYHVLRYPS